MLIAKLKQQKIKERNDIIFCTLRGTECVYVGQIRLSQTNRITEYRICCAEGMGTRRGCEFAAYEETSLSFLRFGKIGGTSG